MNADQQIISYARQAINIESLAVQALANKIDAAFAKCVNLILSSEGRVVITGIGKSAIIAQKVVATLNSTGTPAIFMHAADAVHGDLGMIQKNDVVICISKSGNTPEIKVLVPLLKLSGNKLIALVGDKLSYLAQQADYILDTSVEVEACPNNLAPTSSTTAQLVMGDALAVVLLKCRNFSAKDFAKYHPGGALGKKLYLKVRDVVNQDQAPQVRFDASVKNAIVEITSKRLGATAVVDDKGSLIGVITDGDIRRMLESDQDFQTLKAEDIMNSSPKSIDADAMAIDALQVIRENKVSQLVVYAENQYLGMVHIHDLNREGII